jgi:hypothetical protein
MAYLYRIHLMPKYLFLMLMLMLVTANASAAISKWVDSNGQVHYSDQPPPNVKTQSIRPAQGADASTSASGVPAQKSIAERDAEFKKAQLAKKEAAEKDAQKQAALEAQQSNCSNAQQALRSLQSGIRIVTIDANGERSFLDDSERQQRIEKAQNDVNTYCK